MFLHNISENLKAHSFLYILHQIFKHENRFGQIFDQKEANEMMQNQMLDPSMIVSLR